MKKKIFRSIITVALTVMVASLVIASSFLYDYFNKQQKSQLKDELTLASNNVNELGLSYFDNFKSSIFRFTVVDADGAVLYDSQADITKMGNHLDREEIKEALGQGRGSSSRYSVTLTEKTMYEAVRLDNGDVLRVSVSQVTVGTLIFIMLPTICAIVIISGFVSLILSDKMAASIVKPLGELDLENPTDKVVYEELTPVLSKLNMQHKQIKRQMRELKQKSDEFELIIASMKEGLVLLDKNGTVLNINVAAKKLFGVSSYSVGASFSTVCRNEKMDLAVKEAFLKGHTELREEIEQREYQFIINRTESDGKVLGAVVLCFDITEAAFAERQRREFTGNVSHELKTPLQSIIGSAELLENGLVRLEDTDRFVGNIKNEATRLVTLINDIIRLSQLDEGAESAKESVDLYEVAKEAVEVLSALASKKNVSLTVNGGSTVIVGVRRYLYEIIYNLCDNAIRYNKEGGSVTVTLGTQDKNTYLSVKDTGIGIPKEHKPRIFERFYRVDKSHSKETGGTGLGLSIVKHAAAYHGAQIELLSEENKGTEIIVKFPQ
ncbi:MAG: two-component sensor histidine kinase [Clostridia bacterium]|nr:two-component sensor histidine kinase [Clostridia bacterium]